MVYPPRLSRFNVLELRAIERALAQHLRVSVEQLDEHGFTVVPDSEHALRISWQASAAITLDDFQSIVDEVTAEQTSTGPQPRPGQAAVIPKVTRTDPRRPRADRRDEGP